EVGLCDRPGLLGLLPPGRPCGGPAQGIVERDVEAREDAHRLVRLRERAEVGAPRRVRLARRAIAALDALEPVGSVRGDSPLPVMLPAAGPLERGASLVDARRDGADALLVDGRFL